MRAQIAGQVFVYSLTVVVVGVILLFGYNSIKGFQKNSQEVGVLQFREQLESSIQGISGQYGTLKKKEFKLDSNYKELCFVNNFLYDQTQNPNAVFQKYPLIQDTIVNNLPTRNTFLILQDNTIAEPYNFGQIDLNANFRCFPFRNGVVNFSIEGKGDHVLIS